MVRFSWFLSHWVILDYVDILYGILCNSGSCYNQSMLFFVLFCFSIQANQLSADSKFCLTFCMQTIHCQLRFESLCCVIGCIPHMQSLEVKPRTYVHSYMESLSPILSSPGFPSHSSAPISTFHWSPGQKDGVLVLQPLMTSLSFILLGLPSG